MSRSSSALRWLTVIGLALIGTILALGITINDDALDLLPGDAVQGDLQLLQRLGLVDRVIITLSVSSDLPEAQASAKLQESAARLGLHLEESQAFSHVMARLPQGFELELFRTMQPFLPVLLDHNDLAALEAATTPSGLQAAMAKNFALLNSPAGFIAKGQVQQDPLGMIRLVLEKLKSLRAEYDMRLTDGFLMSSDGRSCLVMAESKLPLTDAHNAQNTQTILDAAYDKSLAPGVEPFVIGSLPHTLANSRSIQHDLRLLLPLASILLLTLLGLSLRDVRAVAVLSVPFMAAPLAIWATDLAFGKISALALGFGIVLLGIAVDFAIHLYLALSRESGRPGEIMARVRRPIAFASLTTSSVFTVLLFSQVPSHRQMALLALVGVLLAVLFSWLLIPTITVAKAGRENNAFKLPTIPATPLLRLAPLALWLGLLGAGIFTWPNLHYNGDLRVLDAPDQEVIAAEDHFRATWGRGDEGRAFIIAAGPSLATALERNSQVFASLSKAEGVQSIAPILPGLGQQKSNMAGWHDFWAKKRPAFDGELKESAVQLGFSESAFSPFFNWLDQEQQLMEPEKMLSGPLQTLLATMIRPPDQQRGEHDEFLIMSSIASDAEMLPELLALEESGPGITVLADKKWRDQVEKMLRQDIMALSSAAACAIILLVGLAFRQLRAIVAVLAPVAAALSAMSLFCFVTGAELNMMHVLMSIMVIGLSVDYGIFIVCARVEGVSHISFMAVSICAASSLIGFGVLALAQHPALHSLGVTVLVGIGAAWPTAILVSPTLLARPAKGATR
ncbi:MAG: MMPL family transporter [Thermodesulfobacteriota bacterium]